LDITTAPLGAGFQQVSVGEERTCALRIDGSVACWGETTDKRLALPALLRFKQISLSGDVLCGVQIDGTAFCSGYDDAIRLIFSDARFTHLSIDYGERCGVTTRGAMACWHPSGGVVWEEDGKYSQVSVYGSDRCALKTDASIECSDRTGFKPPPGSFVQISISLYFGCAVRADKAIECWGDGGEHTWKLPPSNRSDLAAMVANPPAGSYTQVVTGLSHACGLKTDGTIVCWGSSGPETKGVPNE